MTIYSKPDYRVGVWGSDGNIMQPSSDKIELGHVVEKPKNEVMNWIQNRQDTGIAYTLQKGIPDWDNFTEYPKNAVIDYNGTTYRAKVQNTGKQPNTNTTQWGVAYSSSGSDDLVNKIINQDGFLTWYVRKADPVLNGKAQGNGYLAQVGANANGSANVGYAFKTKLNSGLFLINNEPSIQRDGTQVAKFVNSLPSSPSGKEVVTYEMLQQLLQTYKVGDLYLTTNVGNPAQTLGYGTWEKYGQGRALVGHSDAVTSATPDWVKRGGNTYGEYEHALTIQEMPRHNHPDNDFTVYHEEGGTNDFNAWASGHTTRPESQSVNFNNLPFQGGGQSHNNVQPSIVVYVWRRTR